MTDERNETATTGASPDGPSDPEARETARPDDATLLRERIVEAIKTCYDPEIPVDIWELGLIYGLDVGPEGAVTVQMTLTSPACPVAGTLPGEVEERIRGVEGVREVALELVWDPPWSMERMSEPARLQLGFY